MIFYSLLMHSLSGAAVHTLIFFGMPWLRILRMELNSIISSCQKQTFVACGNLFIHTTFMEVVLQLPLTFGIPLLPSISRLPYTYLLLDVDACLKLIRRTFCYSATTVVSTYLFV